MKDEIKEILDDLLFTTTLPNVSIKLNKEKINQLKDYITNLQEENQHLQEVLDYEEDFNRYLKSRIDNVIPMLKELNIKLKGILKIGIDIKEISDIENILQGDDE